MVSSWQRKEAKDTPAQTITDVDYTNDIALLANTPAQAESLLHSLERAAAGIGHHINADKMEYMCFNQRGDISTQNGSSLKLVDKFTYLWKQCLINRNWHQHVTSKGMDNYWSHRSQTWLIKWNAVFFFFFFFFQAVVMSILLYGCTTWTLTKCMEEKLDGNYTRMLRAILSKSWRQHSTKQQLYGHLLPIMKTIQVRWTRHAELLKK